MPSINNHMPNLSHIPFLEVKGLAYEILFEDHLLTHIVPSDISIIINGATSIDGGCLYFNKIGDNTALKTFAQKYFKGQMASDVLIVIYVREKTDIKISQRLFREICEQIPHETDVAWGVGLDSELLDNQIKIKFIVGYK